MSITTAQVLTAPKLRKTKKHGQFHVSYAITEKQEICSITAKDVKNLELATPGGFVMILDAWERGQPGDMEYRLDGAEEQGQV